MINLHNIAVIGHDAEPLLVRLYKGEQGEAVWRRRDADGQSMAWSAAPTLHLPGNVTVNSVLSADGAVADAIATWTISLIDVNTVESAIGSSPGEARVKISGRTMFLGEVSIR